MITVHFEDHGQDFLEWDIEDGVVVACRPFQDWLWNGTKVNNTDIKLGDKLDITFKDGVRRTLNYPVVVIDDHVSGVAKIKVKVKEV